MMLGRVAYRGSLSRRSEDRTAGSLSLIVSIPPSTSRVTTSPSPVFSTLDANVPYNTHTGQLITWLLYSNSHKDYTKCKDTVCENAQHIQTFPVNHTNWKHSKHSLALKQKYGNLTLAFQTHFIIVLSYHLRPVEKCSQEDNSPRWNNTRFPNTLRYTA